MRYRKIMCEDKTQSIGLTMSDPDKKKRDIHSSPVMHMIEGKTHKYWRSLENRPYLDIIL